MRKLFTPLIIIALAASLVFLAACDDLGSLFGGLGNNNTNTNDPANPSDPTNPGNPVSPTDIDPGNGPVNPGNESNSFPIQLYLPNDNVDGFITKAATTDGTAANIVALLVAENALPAGSGVLNFTISGNTGFINMNAAYGQAVSNTGTTAEYLWIGCLVNTMIKYFGFTSLWIEIDGQTLITGHNVYNYALSFYENQVSTPVFSSGLVALWENLDGYWLGPDGFFVGFEMVNGKFFVNYGLVMSGYGWTAEVTDYDVVNLFEVDFKLFRAAVPPSMISDGWPDTYFDASVNFSGLINEIIDFKITDHLDGNWEGYLYCGPSLPTSFPN